ncbi:MAG: Photosynthesis system assembly factor [Bacteroidota bacterium]
MRYIRMNKLLLLLPLLGFVLVNKLPGKFVKMDKVDDDFYIVIRETIDSSHKYPVHHYSLNFEHAYWGEENYSAYYSYDLDSLMRTARTKHPLVAKDSGIIFNSAYEYSDVPELEFVNRKIGFLYGNSLMYGYYPFVYRTEDGGHNWTFYTVGDLKKDASLMGPALTHLHMFDDKHGIILWQMGVTQQFYSLTSDGGATWQQHEFRLSGLCKSGRLSHVAFAGESGITLVYLVTNIVGGSDNDTEIMKSDDYGKTFRRLK